MAAAGKWEESLQALMPNYFGVIADDAEKILEMPLRVVLELDLQRRNRILKGS